MPSDPTTALTEEEFDAIQARFPPAFAGKRRAEVPLSALVVKVEPLTAEHVAAAQQMVEEGRNLGVTTPDLKAIRHTHHRLAQLLAGGMDEMVAAKLCNYSISRVSILKGDPAFQELLAHYSNVVDDAFSDFATAAGELSVDVVHRLQQMLDEEPEKISPGTLIEMGKFLADRSGNAPVQRILNTNVNVNLGDRLRAARERVRAAALPAIPDGG